MARLLPIWTPNRGVPSFSVIALRGRGDFSRLSSISYPGPGLESLGRKIEWELMHE